MQRDRPFALQRRTHTVGHNPPLAILLQTCRWVCAITPKPLFATCPGLFDHSIGAQQDRPRDGETKRFGGLAIDTKVER